MNDKGFSIIELLVVILILLILTSIGVATSDKQLLNIKLQSDASLLALNLRKWGAIVRDLEGAPAYVTFDYQNNVYSFVLNNTLKEAVFLSPGIKFTADTYSKHTANFDFRGNLNNGHIILEDRYKRLRYIIIAPTTGRVRISLTPPESGW